MGFIRHRMGEEDGLFWLELRGDFNDKQMAEIRDIPLSFAHPDDVEIARRGNLVSILFRTIDRERFEDSTPELMQSINSGEEAPRRRQSVAALLRN